MKKTTLFILFLCACCLMQALPPAIRTMPGNQGWTLETQSSLYYLRINEQKEVKLYYFGDKAGNIEVLNHPLGEELTVRGGYSTTVPLMEAIFPDGVRDIELAFVTAETVSDNGVETLVITQKDKFYPLTVKEYIRIHPDYDLIEKWIEITHNGKKGKIKIENLQSGSVFLPKDAYELTHLSGIWGSEYQPNTTLLTQGIKSLEVKDFRSFGSSFFAVCPAGRTSESTGKVWYGTLQYSGNWRMDFSKYATGEVQITGGINFWDQEVTLLPGNSFTTPKILFGYTSGGTGQASRNLAAYTREKVLPAAHRQTIRPVLYNSWYATTFHVNEEQQLALARIAKELGVETFVIDDGWFKGRINDKAGLGDWTVDTEKFPNGLKPLIDKINALGMDFGIWIEPEMVNPNSDLYRAHPDWVFHYPNRTRHEGRNQLMLNLAREDVYQYLYSCFSKLLRENNIRYIKWDMNKSLTDPGFPSAPAEQQRAVRIQYVENLYRLIETLRKEFPDVWFENCASGGGRVDLGMMSRMDFNWASDNTDPVERIFIQHAYLSAFPANTMISWITHEDWHRQNHPLEFKFDVAMAGILGIGNDITQWSEKEKAVAKAKIKEYKEIRPLVQFGTHYRLVSPYETDKSVLQYVSPDKRKAVVFVYNLAEYPNNALPDTRRTQAVCLQGLQPEATYAIEGIPGVYTGKALMETGIVFPLRGAFKSHIYKIIQQ